jgi:hypothetical protein
MAENLTGNPASVDLAQPVLVSIPQAGEPRSRVTSLKTPFQKIADYVAKLVALVGSSTARVYVRVGRSIGSQNIPVNSNDAPVILCPQEVDDNTEFGYGDPRGMHNPATGVITIPADLGGVYVVSVEANISNSQSGQPFQADLMVTVERASVEKYYVLRDYAAVAPIGATIAARLFNVSGPLSLEPGDLLRCRVLSGAGQPLNVSNVRFSAARVSI